MPSRRTKVDQVRLGLSKPFCLYHFLILVIFHTCCHFQYSENKQVTDRQMLFSIKIYGDVVSGVPLKQLANPNLNPKPKNHNPVSG